MGANVGTGIPPGDTSPRESGGMPPHSKAERGGMLLHSKNAAGMIYRHGIQDAERQGLLVPREALRMGMGAAVPMAGMGGDGGVSGGGRRLGGLGEQQPWPIRSADAGVCAVCRRAAAGDLLVERGAAAVEVGRLKWIAASYKVTEDSSQRRLRLGLGII